MEIKAMADIPTLSTLTEPDEGREIHAEQTKSPSTTTTEREIHAKHTNPPNNRGHQYHPRKTRHREPLRSDHDPTNFPISMLSSLLQPCTNFSNFYLFPKKCILNSKSQKDLFEMHASMRGTSQHHNSTHGK